jgi:hypothetical protein
LRTDDLISALASDAPARGLRPAPAVAIALLVAAVLAAVVMFASIDARPDLAQAITTLRVEFKFIVTVSLLLATTGLALRLVLPGVDPGPWRWAPLAAPALAAVAVLLELSVTPSESWSRRLVGQNWWFCLLFVPSLALIPLGSIILALRHGAPARPSLTGAVAGLAAGGLAAALYAFHCPDDSPLFVATWYSLAIIVVAGLGALAGKRFLRW